MKYLILHYTGMATAQVALDRLCDPKSKVSAHYMVAEDGRIFALVPEEKRAWHAGVAVWGADRDINSLSIGIELVNPGHACLDNPADPEKCGPQPPYPPAQMTALVALCRDILSRHAIAARYILGHSDIAPARKCDPGEQFDWAFLAAAGIGLWPAVDGPDDKQADADFYQSLADFGYDISHRAAAVTAFQRHFCPTQVTGVADSLAARRLAGLLAFKV